METLGGDANHDRTKALKEFDDTKAGVKGLVDSSITTIPFFFLHSDLHLTPPSSLSIPTVDLSLPHPLTVDLIRRASRDWGFFQVINHGVPLHVIDQTISAVRSFHDLPSAVKSHHYTRSPTGGVTFSSNVDLFRSKAASWRDTVTVTMGPVRPDVDRIPAVCREELVDWDGHAREVGRRVLGMMSEGLGVGPGRLEEMTCLEGRTLVGHYYPWCPEPDRTVGIAGHTDPGVMTVLVQDGIGGLQVKRKGEDGEESCWVDVKPVAGSLVINVGDLLQMVSNDEYKSVEHRVVANPCREARVSIAIFFNPAKRGESDFYGPLPELVSPEKPALYRNLTMAEFMRSFFSKELGCESFVDQFKLVK